MTTVQEENAVLRACEDLMMCLDKIFKQHPGSVFEYAFWYNDAHDEGDDYGSYITSRTCYGIVQSRLFSKEPTEVVKF